MATHLISFTANCTFCGQDNAVAYWSPAGPQDPFADGSIHVCRQCATEGDLPRLVADGVIGKGPDDFMISRLASALIEFGSAYWRAAAVAIAEMYSRKS